MHYQRRNVLIAAAVGMAANFMPWTSYPIVGSFEGFESNHGWTTFALFLIGLICCLWGDKTVPLIGGRRIAASLTSIVASGLGIWTVNFWGFAHIDYGVWLIIFSGIGLPIAAIMNDGERSTEQLDTFTRSNQGGSKDAEVRHKSGRARGLSFPPEPKRPLLRRSDLPIALPVVGVIVLGVSLTLLLYYKDKHANETEKLLNRPSEEEHGPPLSSEEEHAPPFLFENLVKSVATELIEAGPYLTEDEAGSIIGEFILLGVCRQSDMKQIVWEVFKHVGPFSKRVHNIFVYKAIRKYAQQTFTVNLFYKVSERKLGRRLGR